MYMEGMGVGCAICGCAGMTARAWQAGTVHAHTTHRTQHTNTHTAQHYNNQQTVTSDDCGFRDLALMLLANVSATAQGAKRMMQVLFCVYLCM